LNNSAYGVILQHYKLYRRKREKVMQLMSIEELALYLGDSKRTIYKYIASQDCPPYIKISSKNIKFDRADVDEWLESKKVNLKTKKEK
jgi:excisionase family DNA binding protein